MMSVAMTFARSRRAWRSAIEQLEGRALLSAVVGQFVSTMTTTADSVQLLELNPIDRLPDTAELIAVTELPSAVILAVKAQVPGATIVSAERDAGTGDTQFGVRAKFQGIELTITVSSGGDVLEIERPVAASGLPQSVQDWLSSHFRNASILQAEIVAADGSVSYQLTIATPKQLPVEALLRISNGNSSLTPLALNDSTGRADRGLAPRVQQSVVDRMNSTKDVATTEPRTTSSGGRVATHNSVAAARFAADEQSNAASRSEDVRATGESNGGESKPTVRPADLVLESTLAARRTVMAGEMADVLPVDMGTIERAMREFLDGVGSLAEQAVGDGAAQRWIPSLLTAIVALFGAERLISERRKSDQNLVFAAAGKSSWSWIMKLSMTSAGTR